MPRSRYTYVPIYTDKHTYIHVCRHVCEYAVIYIHTYVVMNACAYVLNVQVCMVMNLHTHVPIHVCRNNMYMHG
jgi:hypothetical protein